MEKLEQRVNEVRQGIAAAAKAAGRDPGEILLLAATKYATAEQINALPALGVHDVGENRVQALLEKWDALDKENLRVHFIGTLQKNKVKYISRNTYINRSSIRKLRYMDLFVWYYMGSS